MYNSQCISVSCSTGACDEELFINASTRENKTSAVKGFVTHLTQHPDSRQKEEDLFFFDGFLPRCAHWVSAVGLSAMLKGLEVRLGGLGRLWSCKEMCQLTSRHKRWSTNPPIRLLRSLESSRLSRSPPLPCAAAFCSRSGSYVIEMACPLALAPSYSSCAFFACLRSLYMTVAVPVERPERSN